MDNKKRKQRIPLSLKDKIAIIRKKETGINISDEILSREYDVDCSTISSIIRKKEELLKSYSNAKTSELKRTRIQPGHFPVLEDALYKWFQGLCSQNIPVSQELLKQKVLYFYNEARIKVYNILSLKHQDDAIEIVGEAWDAILPPNRTVEITDEPTPNDVFEELVSGLGKIIINHIMTAEEFINIDSDIITTELPTDENIVEGILILEGVLQPEDVEMEEEGEMNEKESVISIERGRKALETAKSFLEQQEFATKKDVKYVSELIKHLNSSVDKAKRQSLLTEFIDIKY
nr:11996_t:CDS:2 [Entrophospora candida]